MGQTKRPPETASALAGDQSSEGTREQSHPERVARFGELKKQALSMSAYLGAEQPAGSARINQRLRGCANYLIFNHYYTVEQIRLAKVHTCQIHLLCPFCARARAMKALAKYLERFEQVTADHPHLIPAMLTLTVKNGPDLAERFEHLVKSWRLYCKRRRQALSVGRGHNELCKVDGALFSYELTKGKGGWHPHLHAVVLLDRYIDKHQLSREWHAITGDSSITDIRALKGEPVEAFSEVCKYALKFSDLDHVDTWAAYGALRGRRLQGAFGCLWGVKVSLGAADDLLELPYNELRYRYRPGSGYSLTGPPVPR